MDRDFEKDHRTTYVESSTDSGVTWFIVGALVIAAGVLAYMYFGGDESATTASSPTAIEAPADTGRAATPEPAPPAGGAMDAPAPETPAVPAAPPAPSAPAQ